jgi:predicted dehydrogenase
MAKTFRVGLIGYRFMGRAHSNAWRQAPKFFKLKANVELHTLCGRDGAGVQSARATRLAARDDGLARNRRIAAD